MSARTADDQEPGTAVTAGSLTRPSGLVAGLIVRRTGSLLLPIAVHAAFDLPSTTSTPAG